MGNFKIGDRVKYIVSNNDMLLENDKFGKIGTVKGVSRGMLHVIFDDVTIRSRIDGRRGVNLFSRKFEKIEQIKRYIKKHKLI